MLSRFSLLTLLVISIFVSCRNDNTPPIPAVKDPTHGSAQTMGSQCTLSSESLLGFQVGDSIQLKARKYKFNLNREKFKTSYGDFDVYVYKTPNEETLRIFPVMKNGAERVEHLEYTGAMCQTDKGVGVSSTLSALLKAYPQLEIHGSEKSGRAVARGGEWYFLLGTKIYTTDVDIKSLNQDIRVIAVMLQ